jgi:hypothetical protein
MATTEHSIDVSAEIPAADHERTEFVFRSLVGHYRVGEDAVKWSAADDAECGGLVSLKRLDSGHTRVTVSVDYRGDETVEKAAGAHLDRDLAELKAFAEARES